MVNGENKEVHYTVLAAWLLYCVNSVESLSGSRLPASPSKSISLTVKPEAIWVRVCMRCVCVCVCVCVSV